MKELIHPLEVQLLKRLDNFNLRYKDKFEEARIQNEIVPSEILLMEECFEIWCQTTNSTNTVQMLKAIKETDSLVNSVPDEDKWFQI